MFGPYRPAADMEEMENLILWGFLEKFLRFLKRLVESFWEIFEDFRMLFGAFIRAVKVIRAV